MSIVVIVWLARTVYLDVHAAGVVSVVVDDFNAGMAAGAVAESVVFAAGQAQGPDGQNHD